MKLIPLNQGIFASPRRGVAALPLVALLLAITLIVSLSTAKIIVLDQRSAAESARSQQAAEAADAGIEWATSMLNAGRIESDCTPATGDATTVLQKPSFRQRYLSIDSSTGMISPVMRTDGSTLYAGCVFTGTDWTCSCPTNGNPSLANPVGTANAPAFFVRFTSTPRNGVAAQGNLTRPGVVIVEVNGCTSVNSACQTFPPTVAALESSSVMRAVLALKPALPSSPWAALTASGNVPSNCCLLGYNTNPDRGGVTIAAGGTIGANALVTTYGSPAGLASTRPNDPRLSSFASFTTVDRFAVSFMGLFPSQYMTQPAAVLITCPPSGYCDSQLQLAAAQNPDRILVVTNDLYLSNGGSPNIGSRPSNTDTTVVGPVMIYATKSVMFDGPGAPNLWGVIYMDLTPPASGPQSVATGWVTIWGATIVKGDVPTTFYTQSVYGSAQVDALRFRSGSFVRVAGGWRDMQ